MSMRVELILDVKARNLQKDSFHDWTKIGKVKVDGIRSMMVKGTGL